MVGPEPPQHTTNALRAFQKPSGPTVGPCSHQDTLELLSMFIAAAWCQPDTWQSLHPAIEGFHQHCWSF